MTIIWGGTLAVILTKLRRKLFRVDKQRYSVEDQIKRIGVYYMCIDDLPIEAKVTGGRKTGPSDSVVS